MSAFANALQEFQADRLNREQLLSEVHRSLAVDRRTPGELRVELNDAHAVHALPAELRAAILERLTSWDQTITTPTPRQSLPDSGLEQPATIFIGEESVVAREPVTGGNTFRAPPVGVGSTLQGRFRLIALVGEGGMSRVFKAIDLRRVEAESAEPHVAIKVLTVPFRNFVGSMAAMQNEAHKLQKLTHQNIVRVMDCDRDGQTVFMTMELLSGQSVYSRLRDPAAPLSREESESIVTGVAHALAFAHRHHIVHGDLKPGNVIITDNGEVKVIDFGVARFIAGQQANTTDPPTAITPRYASPQLWNGEAPAEVDDVFSLGCLAYEVMTGQHPFATQSSVQAPTSAAMRLTRSAKLTSGQFNAISRAVQYERAARTQTVDAFLNEFAVTTGAASRARLFAAMAVILVIVGFGVWRFHPGAEPAIEPRATVAAAPAAHAFAPGTVFRDCPLCPLMVVVPAGRFTQGSAADAADAQSFERPQHPVTLQQSFAMGQNEVTIAEFRQFVVATSFVGKACNVYDGHWNRQDAADWQRPGYPITSQDPVSCVSWADASAYVRWLSKTTGQPYRLPSASEWEYAAAAGSSAQHPWRRDSDACAYANVADRSASNRYPGWHAFACEDRFVTVAPVGSFKPNDFGLNDMLGNVFEWVQDCWHDTYDGAPQDGAARLDGPCTERELRGGSWFTSPGFVRTAYRNRFDADYRSSSVGFRVVREVPR